MDERFPAHDDPRAELARLARRGARDAQRAAWNKWRAANSISALERAVADIAVAAGTQLDEVRAQGAKESATARAELVEARSTIDRLTRQLLREEERARALESDMETLHRLQGTVGSIDRSWTGRR